MSKARRVMGGLASDAQAQVAAAHLQALENRALERLELQADLTKIYPSQDNPRRISLDLAGVTLERVEELAIKPKETVDQWRNRQEAFLKELWDKNDVVGHGVWSELFSLAGSIWTSGLMQPIVAQPTGEIIAGERRWTAAKLAGKRTERVIFRVAKDDEVHLMRLIENLHRSDLSVAEIASAVRKVVTTSGVVGELTFSNREISVDRMVSIFGCGRTQATYYRALCLLPDGDELLEQILAGAYTSLRVAYTDAAERVRAMQAKAQFSDHLPSGAVEEPQINTKPATPVRKPGAGTPQVKMPLPGTQSGVRILKALSSIEDLPNEAVEVLSKTMSGWTAAPDKARKQMLAKALENVIASLETLDNDDADDGEPA